MLIGHLAAQEFLYNLHMADRLPHALVFYGPQGIGKRTLADIVARFIICGGTFSPAEGLKPASSNPVLAQIEAGACADLLTLTPEAGKKITVEQSRNMLNQLQLKPMGRRVILIDAADDLGHEAANTLLKCVEEPAPNTHFLIIAHNLFRVLPTILSRCRQLRLHPLSQTETEEVLTQQGAENPAALAALAPGLPGQGLYLGAEALALQEKLAAGGHPVELADEIQQKKQVPLALDLLKRQIAKKCKQNPTYQSSQLYVTLADLQQRMLSHNLSGNWVMETALRKIAQ